MLEKKFVLYSEALELKKLGFNELCLGCYDEKSVFGLTVMSIKQYYTNSKEDTWNCAAPLYQQAFRWFRDKGYEAFPKKTENNEYYYTIEYGHWTFIMDDKYNSYEEAELACLKKLIQIVKEKQ